MLAPLYSDSEPAAMLCMSRILAGRHDNYSAVCSRRIERYGMRGVRGGRAIECHGDGTLAVECELCCSAVGGRSGRDKLNPLVAHRHVRGRWLGDAEQRGITLTVSGEDAHGNGDAGYTRDRQPVMGGLATGHTQLPRRHILDHERQRGISF